MSPYGGAIDTNDKGDFTLNRTLGASTDAGDLSEALAHRWSFKNGSLVDSIGGLTAVTNGAVDLEDGAVRLKGLARGLSCVNLGTTLLPTNGFGATIELWVTPLSYKSWARVIAFGSGTGTSKDIYLSFNNGKSTDDARSHFRIYGSGTDEYATTTAMPPGRTYHVAIVLDPQLDGRFIDILRAVPNAKIGNDVFFPYDFCHIFLRFNFIHHPAVFRAMIMQLQPLNFLIQSFGVLQIGEFFKMLVIDHFHISRIRKTPERFFQCFHLILHKPERTPAFAKTAFFPVHIGQESLQIPSRSSIRI